MIAEGDRLAGPYLGNDVQTTFTFEFKVFEGNDLLVEVTDGSGAITTPVFNVDYSVTLNPNQDTEPGGDVIFVDPPGAGSSIVITSDLGVEQPAVFTNQGNFYPSVLNDSLDRLTIYVQQLAVTLGRALLVPLGETMAEIPPEVLRANRFLGFDTDGNLAIRDGTQGTVTWGQIEGKPTTFPPSGHTHAFNEIFTLEDTLVGRSADGPGACEAIALGVGLSLIDGVLESTGNGDMVYPAAGIAVSTGSLWGASKTTPDGGIVGTTDAQTLTNKTLSTGEVDGGVVVSDSGLIAPDSVGFRGAPIAYGGSLTLALEHAGKLALREGTITIPSNASVPFPSGTVILLYNNTAGNIAVNLVTDVLRFGTGTGNRHITPLGLATLIKVGPTTWAITGDVV